MTFQKTTVSCELTILTRCGVDLTEGGYGNWTNSQAVAPVQLDYAPGAVIVPHIYPDGAPKIRDNGNVVCHVAGEVLRVSFPDHPNSTPRFRERISAALPGTRYVADTALPQSLFQREIAVS